MVLFLGFHLKKWYTQWYLCTIHQTAGLDLGLVTNKSSYVTSDTVEVNFSEQSSKKWMSTCAVLHATPPADPQLKSLVANCYPDSRANAELYSLSRNPISARQDFFTVGCHHMLQEGFEQKAKSCCGTASYGSAALSMWKHISHVKITDYWMLCLSGTLA